MHMLQSPQSGFSSRPPSRARLISLRPSFVPLLAACAAVLAAHLVFTGSRLVAQTPPAPNQAVLPSQNQPAARQKPSSAAPASPQSSPQPSQPAPPAPNWPANDSPAPASIIWDSHGLEIVASNSSLSQILKEVSLATGAKVEGFESDERIFGIYGPGSARDVLSSLLDGSNYNVLLIGDQGMGTPRRVVLTLRSGSTPQPGGAAPSPADTPNDDDTEAEEQAQQPEQPPPGQQPPQYPPAPGMPVHNPQQMIQEMQERQRQLQQQQQQQQPQN